MSDWKPGTFAMVTIDGREYPAVRGRVPFHNWYVNGPVLGSQTSFSDKAVTDVRPLVTIDPENREQVERLDKAIRKAFSGAKITEVIDNTSLMRAALREYAHPTPPKPDEPTGLGAVVEDADGRQWVYLAKTAVAVRGGWDA